MTIKALLFDLDGVISDTHLLHFKAYQQALKEIYNFEITLGLYDSIGSVPTRERTAFLCDKDYIPYDSSLVENLHAAKKSHTYRLNASMTADEKLIALLHKGKDEHDLRYAVASNASDEFVNEVLNRKQINLFFDSVIGSYSIAQTKPHPMMYLQSMANLAVAPSECIVVEDSNTGMVAGHRSGALVYRVNGPEDVNDNILDLVGQLNK